MVRGCRLVNDFSSEPNQVARRHTDVVKVRARVWVAFVGLFVVAAVVVGVGAGDAGASLGWSVTRTAHAPSSLPSGFNGVTCPRVSSCFAVGDARSPVGTTVSLIEHWDGTGWRVMASPNPKGAEYANLGGVSCASPTSCFAVGASEGPSSYALVERWDGQRWSIMPSPSFGPNETWLFGVSCPSTTSCVAVGIFGDGMLIERWDGKRWSAITIVPKVPMKQVLYGVSCPSPTSCVAVGTAFSPDRFVLRTLVEHWNGKHWSVMAGTPNPSAFDQFNAVSCRTARHCVAVGTGGPGGPEPDHALAERWDGHGGWSLMGGIDRPDNADLTGLSCPTATDCFAVGTVTTGSTIQTLIEHWDGYGGWSIMASPSATNPFLRGLSCPNQTNCYAVGNGNQRGTLVERYS